LLTFSTPSIRLTALSASCLRTGFAVAPRKVTVLPDDFERQIVKNAVVGQQEQSVPYLSGDAVLSRGSGDKRILTIPADLRCEPGRNQQNGEEQPDRRGYAGDALQIVCKSLDPHENPPFV
jgi:hypothetical protein